MKVQRWKVVFWKSGSGLDKYEVHEGIFVFPEQCLIVMRSRDGEDPVVIRYFTQTAFKHRLAQYFGVRNPDYIRLDEYEIEDHDNPLFTLLANARKFLEAKQILHQTLKGLA